MRTPIFIVCLPYLQSVVFAETDKLYLCIHLSHTNCITVGKWYLMWFWIQTPIELNGSLLTDKNGICIKVSKNKQEAKKKKKEWIVVMGRKNPL